MHVLCLNVVEVKWATLLCSQKARLPQGITHARSDPMLGLEGTQQAAVFIATHHRLDQMAQWSLEHLFQKSTKGLISLRALLYRCLLLSVY